MNDQDQRGQKLRFYQKTWVRLVALSLAVVLLITAIYFQYGSSVSVDAAVNMKLASKQLEKSEKPEVVEKAKTQPVKTPEETTLSAKQVFELAQTYEEAGEYESARECYTALIESEAYDPGYYVYRGRCSLFLDDFEKVSEDCQKYLDAGGIDEDGSIQYMQIVSYMQQEKYPEVIELANEYLDTYGELQEMFYYRGICELMTEQFEPALTDLRKVTEMGGDDEITAGAADLLTQLQEVPDEE